MWRKILQKILCISPIRNTINIDYEKIINRVYDGDLISETPMPKMEELFNYCKTTTERIER